MTENLPLSAQLSAAFVALAIEIDNAAELDIAHRTTAEGPGGHGAVWLASIAMWFSAIRALSDADELTVAELRQRTGLDTNVDGLRRWGYATLNGVGHPLDARPRPIPAPSSVLHLTARGRDAAAIWAPLPAEIERRWRERFGGTTIDELRSALVAVTQVEKRKLPDYLPILTFGLRAEHPQKPWSTSARSAADAGTDASLPLVSLLARALLSLTLDYEATAQLALPVWANGLRLLSPLPVPVRDLAARAGVGKEAMAMVLKQVEGAGCAETTPVPGGRGKQIGLTSVGQRALSVAEIRVAELNHGWGSCTESQADALRAALGPLIGDGTRSGSALFDGLEPGVANWRVGSRPAEHLPWYPLVLHRGGYPDGS
jgi:DNA-binding MarR family transcriptional regulator